MKLIVFPLSILVLFSLLSLTGLGSGILGGMTIGGDTTNAVYYDSAGRSVVYVSNLTAVSDTYLEVMPFYVFPDTWAAFTNSTLEVAHWSPYFLYYDNGAERPVKYEDLGKTDSGVALSNISISSSLGIVALVIGIMALAAVVGLRIVGSGVSEESVSAIVKGSAFLALWAIFSVLSMDLIVLGADIFLPIVYFVLTLIYTLGVINQIGHPGDD